MNSDSLLTATSPYPTDDAEVLSRRVVAQGEIVLEAPQGDIPDTGRMGNKTPKGSNGGGNKFGSQPNTVPEPQVVPDSVGRPLAKGASRLC